MNKHLKFFAVSLTALVAAAALTGCGGSASAGGSSASGSKGVTVSLKSTTFNPKSVEIKAGTTVTWQNDDPTDHSVWEGDPDADNHLFHSPSDLQPNEKFSYTFDKPGTYQIYCNTAAHHLIGMKMTVVVK